jgi:hypothetical protein
VVTVLVKGKYEATGSSDPSQVAQVYEAAIAELEATRDPGVAGLIQRFETHRADVIAALAAQGAA